MQWILNKGFQVGSQKRYQNKVDSKNLKTKFIRKKRGGIKSREFSLSRL